MISKKKNTTTTSIFNNNYKKIDLEKKKSSLGQSINPPFGWGWFAYVHNLKLAGPHLIFLRANSGMGLNVRINPYYHT